MGASLSESVNTCIEYFQYENLKLVFVETANEEIKLSNEAKAAVTIIYCLCLCNLVFKYLRKIKYYYFM